MRLRCRRARRLAAPRGPPRGRADDERGPRWSAALGARGAQLGLRERLVDAVATSIREAGVEWHQLPSSPRTFLMGRIL